MLVQSSPSLWRVVLGAALALVGSAASAHGTSTSAPWEACAAQQRDAECSFSDGHGDLYKGSCQLFSGNLMCVRNQPIVRGAAAAERPGEHAHEHAAAD